MQGNPETPPAVEVQGLERRYGNFAALDKVSLSVRKGEFLSLLGPSGCGKTTLLRLIAGLDLPDSGSVKIGGADMQGIPAHRRPVNTVFQSYALFPHLSVSDNVAFGLRMKRVADSEVRERVERALTLVQINDLAARRPAQLSGGQKQRVALARALINEPAVLLLDEPLAALDLRLRQQLQGELRQLQRRLGTTFIYVTHDQDEALRMSDRIAVMQSGRIEQLDWARKVYERPRNRYVAQFLGSCNLIAGKVTAKDADGFDVAAGMGELRVDLPEDGPLVRKVGSLITLAIRPERIQIAGGLAAQNSFPARLEGLTYRGTEMRFELRAGGQELHSVALNVRNALADLLPGEEVNCHLPPDALIPLND